jgi:hypothetical protein
VIAGVQYRFTVQGNKLNLSPTPPDNIEIAFNYYSNAFCEDGDTGEAKADFSTDGDICRLDGDLVIRGVKWRFAQRKGLPYAEYKADYMAAIDALQGIDTPKDVINLTGCRTVRTNIPDTGYGQ